LLIKEHVLTEVNSNRYTIKFAKSEQEVDEALKLRYRVFKEELDRKFRFQDERDRDQFDDQSHHLIVIENESQKIVGTYRLQTYEQAVQGNGFVSSHRFHIEQLPPEVLNKSVEVGRACIDPAHRSGRVLFLLWKGFAGYLTHFEKRYLFGYSAFNTDNPEVLLNTYELLKQEGKIHPDYHVEVKNPFKIDQSNLRGKTTETDIPPLLQNYLDVGSYVCSRPSFNEQDKLGHCIILLDVEKISDKIRKLFFG
jgi:putative hemolysin